MPNPDGSLTDEEYRRMHGRNRGEPEPPDAPTVEHLLEQIIQRLDRLISLAEQKPS